ncbi:MAG: MurR/RpiR family transcriptional regulator [Candidatus Ratteibacteria bacterium]
MDINLYRKIQILLPVLTASEKKVAKYLCTKRMKIPFLSIYDIAKTVGVSTATVSRIARKAGCRNFTEMKILLARETENPLNKIFGDIKPEDSDEEIVHKVFQGNIKSLEDTLHITDTDKLSKLAKTIVKANRLICIGIGGSGNVAQDTALRFSHLDIQAESYTDYYQILIQALRTNAKTVVLGISRSGRSTITVEGLRIAREKGSVTVGISNYLNSPLHAVSDFFFCTSFTETGVKAAALSSRIAQLCLIDAIYILVARYKKKLWDIERLNSLADKILRKKTNE